MRIRTYGVVRGVMLKHPPTRFACPECKAPQPDCAVSWELLLNAPAAVRTLIGIPVRSFRGLCVCSTIQRLSLHADASLIISLPPAKCAAPHGERQVRAKEKPGQLSLLRPVISVFRKV